MKLAALAAALLAALCNLAHAGTRVTVGNAGLGRWNRAIDTFYVGWRFGLLD